MRIKRIQVREIEKPAEAPVDLNLLDPLILKYTGKRGNMIPLLQGAQDLYGYIPREVFLKISEKTGIDLSDMYGVATFYAQFRLKPVGKNIIKVCHGTACHVQNATAITDAIKESLKIDDGETTPDGL
ncbi:MAG: NAD(P)H-dependent oxidoreductase subunit E, partial [Bacteroidota bacterium]|nr:NAD(P)H-dependent oxidoreductase subunit E [Bacteroidota bacterium]